MRMMIKVHELHIASALIIFARFESYRLFLLAELKQCWQERYFRETIVSVLKETLCCQKLFHRSPTDFSADVMERHCLIIINLGNMYFNK